MQREDVWSPILEAGSTASRGSWLDMPRCKGKRGKRGDDMLCLHKLKCTSRGTHNAQGW